MWKISFSCPERDNYLRQWCQSSVRYSYCSCQSSHNSTFGIGSLKFLCNTKLCIVVPYFICVSNR